MRNWLVCTVCCLVTSWGIMLQKSSAEVILAEVTPCQDAFAKQHRSLSLDFKEFDQMPNQGWRYLAQMDCYREAYGGR